MKICMLSTSDIKGGAAIGTYRLHKSLQQMGEDSTLLVAQKASDDFTVIGANTKLEKAWGKIAPSLSALPLHLYPKRDNITIYSVQWLPDRIVPKVLQLNPDIIYLHWICNGFVNIETLKRFKKPLVWKLADMWAFTGGCHYSYECDNYTKKCGDCPQLHSETEWDLSRWVWQRKAKAWKDLNLTIVATSKWLAECARSSSLLHDLPIEVIPNGLDTQIYKPIDRNLAKNLLNLPQDKQIILFGAVNATSDPRKGFSHLCSALQQLSQSQWRDKIELVIFGASQPKDLVDFHFRTHYLGHLYDDISQALVYSASDVMVVPSLQEAFGLTAMESLACATPVVAFNATGLKDIIEHQQNGYVAQPFEIEDLAHGIAWVLEDRERYAKLCDRARQKVEEEFTLEIQATNYLKLFYEILDLSNEN